MDRRWKIASIGGIPIFITVPWLIFAGFVVWGMYASLAQTQILTEGEALAWSLANAALFYGSIVVHELAHAASARAFGLTVHGVTLVFWGGYTEIHSSERGPFASFLISAAGPISTLALAGVFWIGERAADGVLSALLGRLAFLSLLFAGLNALPGFPVDGGRMLMAVVWAITRDRFTALKVAGWGGVVVGAALGSFAVVRLRDGHGDWIFFAFVGWMMIGQGVQVSRQAPILRELSRGRVSEAMSAPPTPIPDHATLLQALDTHLRDDPTTDFPVVDGSGQMVGALSFKTAAKIGGSDPTRGVREAMTPRGRVRVVEADQPLDRALEGIAGKGQAFVLDGEQLVGRLTSGDVDRWFARTMHGIEARGGPEMVPPRPDLPGRGVGGEG